MSDTARVGEALALRRVLLDYLGREHDAAAADAVCAAPLAAWSLFLKAEYCALPLAARLRRSGLLGRLSKEIADRITLVESAELQRVLAARHVIRELDELAGDSGIRLSILKGGAHAVMRGRQPVHVSDVDVLVARRDAPAAWNAFLARGWTPTFEGASPDAPASSRIHFAPLRSPRQELLVELHDRFEYGPALGDPERFELAALDGFRNLDRLAGPSAFLATLRHTVIKHPIRRGHFRDLFFLADALSELDDESMRGIHDRLADDEYAAELREMLEQARALAEGRSVTESDQARRIVAWKYAIVAGSSRILSARLPGWTGISHIPLERGVLRRAAYADELRSAMSSVAPDSSVASFRGLRSKVAQRLGAPRVVRGAYRVALLAALLACGSVIRRHVQRLADAGRGR
jgi:hypothetical protein